MLRAASLALLTIFAVPAWAYGHFAIDLLGMGYPAHHKLQGGLGDDYDRLTSHGGKNEEYHHGAMWNSFFSDNVYMGVEVFGGDRHIGDGVNYVDFKLIGAGLAFEYYPFSKAKNWLFVKIEGGDLIFYDPYNSFTYFGTYKRTTNNGFGAAAAGLSLPLLL